MTLAMFMVGFAFLYHQFKHTSAREKLVQPQPLYNFRDTSEDHTCRVQRLEWFERIDFQAAKSTGGFC